MRPFFVSKSVLLSLVKQVPVLILGCSPHWCQRVMKVVAATFLWLFLLPSATSVSIKFRRTRLANEAQHERRATGINAQTLASRDDGSVSLEDFHDLLYIANVSVGGTEYPLQVRSRPNPWLNLYLFLIHSVVYSSWIAARLISCYSQTCPMPNHRLVRIY